MERLVLANGRIFMNEFKTSIHKTEYLAYLWLIKNKCNKEEIVHNPCKSPDFIINNKIGFEVKGIKGADKKTVSLRWYQLKDMKRIGINIYYLFIDEEHKKSPIIVPINKIKKTLKEICGLKINWEDKKFIEENET